MVIGIVLIIFGVIGMFANSIFLISIYTKFKKENELAFITIKGYIEPKTLKMTKVKTELSDYKDPEYFYNKEHKQHDFENTVVL